MSTAAPVLDYSYLDHISQAVRRGNPSEVSDEIEHLKSQIAPHQSKIANRSDEGARLIGDRRFVKSLSFLADAAYLRGDFEEARLQVEEAALWIRETILTKREKVRDRETRLLRRQQVWLVACDAAACIRLGKNERAKELLELSAAFVTNWLQDEEFPCYGTRARIDFYTGLLALNSGDPALARRFFDRATEMAIARCKQALAEKGKDAADRDSERIFKKRCLGRLQAFGYGLASLCEGKLLHAKVSFYFALELLQNPERTGSQAYHDELMANQVRLWLILVRTMLISFDKDGLKQLHEMLGELNVLIYWFRNRPGDFGPDRLLAGATQSLAQLRVKQITGVSIDDLLPVDGGSRILRKPSFKATGWESDLTTLITNLVSIWVAIDSDPFLAANLIRNVNVDNITIPFWSNELYLADKEAQIEVQAIRAHRSGGIESSDIEQVLLRAIDMPTAKLKVLTAGQTLFAEVLKARAYHLLSEAGEPKGHPKQSSKTAASGRKDPNVSNDVTPTSRRAHWQRMAASIAFRLRNKRVSSGILKWKIQRLPSGELPGRLPLPDEVGYPASHIDLFILLAGHNAIIECISADPGVGKRELSRKLESIGLTRQRQREYWDAFPELQRWLAPKGPQRARFERHNHGERLTNYRTYLKQLEDSRRAL